MTPPPGICNGSVMSVDDNPANLKLLESMLRLWGYEVRSFPRGRLALAAAAAEPPDLILLDINMPEMNGYEVCKQLKIKPRLAGIPVIFLSALNSVEDKLQGFRAGGVDYISKPFQLEEVHARVSVHVGLRRARRAEHRLLAETLNGAVGSLWELLQLASPPGALRSRSLRRMVAWLNGKLDVGYRRWQFDLAATLALLGCLTVPEHIFERGYGKEPLNEEETKVFHSHPQIAARMLGRIPGLELVAEIIRRQMDPEGDENLSGDTLQGVRMLRLALEVDRRMYRGATLRDALAACHASRHFHQPWVDLLETYSPGTPQMQEMRLPIRDLRNGMLMARDLWSKDKSVMILKEGTALTETWIERLCNFARTVGVDEPVDVLVTVDPDDLGAAFLAEELL